MTSQPSTDNRQLVTATLKLLDYCKTNDWAGYDPYDGLNSKVFQLLKFLDFRYFRLALIQGMKRSPINFRSLFLVPRSQNPKGIALFLTAAVKLSELGVLSNGEIIRSLSERLLELCSLGDAYAGWGYNFNVEALAGPMLSRTPNIICTTFAANALLDAYEIDPDPRFIDTAVAAAKFVHDRFYWEGNNSGAFFNYTPAGIEPMIPIHNANLLGAALLCRVAHQISDKAMLYRALKATRYSIRKQHDDGSWDYGEWDRPSQRWIDNFHTGFNLCALQSISRDAETSEFGPNIRHGLDFYLQHFFHEDGAPKYYHDCLYPIDIHSAAQSIITLTTFKDRDSNSLKLANKVFSWSIRNMWDEQGYFYFQKHLFWTIKISYMRWAQAWMLLAMATLEEARRSR